MIAMQNSNAITLQLQKELFECREKLRIANEELSTARAQLTALATFQSQLGEEKAKVIGLEKALQEEMAKVGRCNRITGKGKTS